MFMFADTTCLLDVIYSETVFRKTKYLSRDYMFKLCPCFFSSYKKWERRQLARKFQTGPSPFFPRIYQKWLYMNMSLTYGRKNKILGSSKKEQVITFLEAVAKNKIVVKSTKEEGNVSYSKGKLQTKNNGFVNVHIHTVTQF